MSHECKDCGHTFIQWKAGDKAKLPNEEGEWIVRDVDVLNDKVWIEHVDTNRRRCVVTDRLYTLEVVKEAVYSGRVDHSRPVLEKLLEEGYDTTMWRTSPTAQDGKCKSLDGQQWRLEDFLAGLQHDAPVYERSHVQCTCHVVVTGPGKPEVRVNWEGIV